MNLSLCAVSSLSLSLHFGPSLLLLNPDIANMAVCEWQYQLQWPLKGQGWQAMRKVRGEMQINYLATRKWGTVYPSTPLLATSMGPSLWKVILEQ